MTDTFNQPGWVDAELRLAGMLDQRMMALLRAVDDTGSINQAAKQVGLSYKGAWQMIERANNLAPKALIATATGGSKGGGTCLTTAGRALLDLFSRLQSQHRQFLQTLNQGLADDPDMVLLLKRQVIKTSAGNQLFGQIVAIRPGAVSTEVSVALKGGENIVASLTRRELADLNLNVGDDALLLINPPEIMLVDSEQTIPLSARNKLVGEVIRRQTDGIDAEVVIQLAGGETVVAIVTQASAEAMALQSGRRVGAVFKSNAVMLGVMPAGS